jgi:hypothetical protein
MHVPGPSTRTDRQTSSSDQHSAKQTPSTDRPPGMTALDRARTYAAIFISAGDRWRNYVPVDANVTGDTVHLQGVRMEHSANGWRLETNDEAWVIRAKGGAA